MIPGNINTDLISGAEGAYQVERSLRFNSADSAYLSRTPASAGNRKTWTWSGWVKRVVIGQPYEYLLDAGVADNFGFTANSAYVYFGSGPLAFKTSSAVFRDPGAWLHYLISLDSTNATAEDRCQIWINGVRLTAWSSNPTIPLNFEGHINSTATHTMCHALGYTFMSAYLADIHFIDGQALTPSSFGETNATTGQWVPKAYSGSYGTNGFKLSFSNNASTTTISQDSSGNNNHWTANNISVTAGAGNDSLVDTPTSYGTDTGAGGEVRGNYATLNPLKKGSNITLTNGNLDASTTLGSGSVHNTIGVSSGKWYWECTLISGSNFMLGIAKGEAAITEYTGQNANSWSYYSANGNKYTNNSTSSYSATYTANDVIGVALDADNGTLTFYKNGVSQGQAYSGLTSGPYFASCSDAGGGSSANSAVFNFGQRPFAYTAPSGFKALCDTNLPAPVVAKPSTVMDVKLYTGNGSTQTISGLGFSPDLVWNKNRSGANSHSLFDTIRGATKQLNSNLTDAESTDVDKLTAFTSDGFTVGNSPGVNASGNSYVAWTWDAGSSTVANTQGSITSSVRANASSGFSVVTYTVGNNTSQTIGHGLGVAPQLIIVKERNQANNWQVYHASLGNGSFLYLNSTNASGSNNLWNNTSPTSTVFSIRSGGSANFYDGKDHVAYCFAPVAGYSSFGSWTNNNSTDGVFVYTGMRPRFIILKNTDNVEQWFIFDSVRRSYNVQYPDPTELRPNSSGAEGSYSLSVTIDFLSNGFKIRGSTSSEISFGTRSYVYAAFAENPFQYARAR